MLEFSCRTSFVLGTSVQVSSTYHPPPKKKKWSTLEKRKQLGVFRLLHEILVRNFCVVREGFLVVPQAGVNRIIPII